MNEVFRFLFLRPPAPGQAVTVTPSAEFANELAEADNAPNRKTALKAVANSLVSSERGLSKLSDLILGDALVATEQALAAWDDPTSEQVAAAVNEAVGGPPSSIVGSTEFGQDRDRLADNLLAAKLLSRDGAVEARQMEAMLRLMAVMERVAADDETLQEAGAVRAALQRPTLIGQAIAAPSRDLPEEEPPPEEPERPDPRVKSLRDEIKTLEDLTRSLTHARPESFFVPAERVPKAPETETPEEETAEETLRRILVDKIRTGDIEQIQPKAFRRAAKTLLALHIPSSALEDAGEIRAPAPRLTLTRNAAQALPEPQRRALALLGLDLTKISVPSALTKITGELTQLHTQLAKLEAKKFTVTRIGSYLVEADKLVAGIATGSLASTPTVPSTHAKAKPVGVGDLLIVREQLKRYQGGEVGHIENILQGEFKKREHLRRRETEETVTIETETKEEEERDSQTTERFELQMEASQVLKDDSSFKAGLSVSGSYGPTVEFKASTDFAMNDSKEESAKTATNYAKEVTNRASFKVSERHREERILRTLEVFEERNEHGVDNTGADGHIVGVYQWVDKVYEAQVFNYGKRMMFDVMAPEPAAFWIFANTQKPMPNATLEKPEPFTKTHKDINEANYGELVKTYEVSGVKPPPEPYITVSKGFEGVGPSSGAKVGTKVAEVPIPDGYQAVKTNLFAECAVLETAQWRFVVAVGRQIWKMNAMNSAVGRTLHNEQGSIPLGIYAFDVLVWVTTVEIDCQRTERAYEAWQLETHAAIQQAYLKLERDYNEELTALEVRAGIEVQGRNPVENRMIERAELKKYAISFFTAQHYDLFGAITQSPEGYPQAKLAEAEAEGRYIRFFEQAFEWEHMVYLFYPYFWGRKARWALQALLQDVDPQFAEFLKAGAARIVVPVRLGFEAALAHFMDTGEIWEGADPPTLTSPLYVSIIDEIKERTDAPGSELPQGDPWEVKLPTTLVKLRPDNSLPTWSKQPDGSWLEN